MAEKLADVVSVSPQFQKSIKIDHDYGDADYLNGYICQHSSLSILDNMSTQIMDCNHSAFTWTGPYGGGKSSLALMLCSLLSPDTNIRRKANKALGITQSHQIHQAFNTSKTKWEVLPIVGERGNVIDSINSALHKLNPRKRQTPKTGRETILALTALAKSDNNSGVLLVIDELGKFLEHAARTDGDIYFYQELAEAASRCNGKFIVVGILHQAFEQYSTRLGLDTKNEWSKIQGRYIDIPIVSATDEMVQLIGKAINNTSTLQHKKYASWADAIYKAIQKRRPGTPKSLSLALKNSWPLHPITTALIGPISKRRFSQNERSAFGFISSAEPLSFSEYLKVEAHTENTTYTPAMYWDYLRANQDLSIIASPDGNRWSAAVDAVERTQSKGSALHIELIKTIALIDLFGASSGIHPESDVLNALNISGTKTSINKALTELEKWSVIIFRKHLNAWALFAGSDFDLDKEISRISDLSGSFDASDLGRVLSLEPVVAKKHYQETGNIRWFNRSIASKDNLSNHIFNSTFDTGCSGQFILLLPEYRDQHSNANKIAKEASKFNGSYASIIGVTNNAEKIKELGIRLSSLTKIRQKNTSLDGDLIARKEITAQIAITSTELNQELRNGFNAAKWYFDNKEIKNTSDIGLSRLASDIADDIYYLAPCISSELINRESINSTVAKARRLLMYKMADSQDKEHLAFKSLSTEAGLYYTTLKSLGIHQAVNNKWQFGAPPQSSHSVYPSWQKIDQLITSFDDKRICLDDIYSVLKQPPYGIKTGYLPIFVFAYFLANRKNLAVYIDNTFTPDIDEVQIDEWLQDPARIAFRYIEIESTKRIFLDNLSKSLTKHLERKITSDPLNSASALVALIYALPSWTKSTDKLSAETKEIRQMLLRASDPHKVLFNDLPNIYDVSGKALADKVGSSIRELVDAYPNMLNEINSKFLASLDNTGNICELNARASKVLGSSGDFKLDAFIARLSTHDNSQESIEGILSLAANKRPTEWVDRDADAAVLKLSEWAFEVRKIEALITLENDTNSRRSMAVVFGSGGGYTLYDEININDDDLRVNAIVDALLKEHSNTDTSIFLAALAETGARLLNKA